MTNREMLELAAKAAGLRFAWEPALRADDTESLEPIVFSDSGFGEYWNPIIDDGDALRLAAKLGLVVDCSRPSAGLPFYSHIHAEIGNSDTYAATRRAITRAAAEIGKSMEGKNA